MNCKKTFFLKFRTELKISGKGETEKDSDGNEMKRLFIAGANWAPTRLFN